MTTESKNGNVQEPQFSEDDVKILHTLAKILNNPKVLEAVLNSRYSNTSELSERIQDIRSKEFISVAESALLLDVSPKTIYSSLKNKKRPFPVKPQRIGGCIRFHRRSLEAAFSNSRKGVK